MYIVLKSELEIVYNRVCRNVLSKVRIIVGINGLKMKYFKDYGI